jgi:hypothetical protein
MVDVKLIQGDCLVEMDKLIESGVTDISLVYQQVA